MGMSTNSDALLADINVTPFVDVMLVLLIIFMVTAPMLTQGLDVDLPQTKAVSALPEDSEVLVLTVKADGSLWLDQYQVTLAELPDHLQRLVKEQKKHLFLKADRAVPYGAVVEVMGEIKAAGIENLGVVADP
ncbi:MAG: protein TolR, partial [Desulfovibrionaceae bacterium]